MEVSSGRDSDFVRVQVRGAAAVVLSAAAQRMSPVEWREVGRLENVLGVAGNLVSDNTPEARTAAKELIVLLKSSYNQQVPLPFPVFHSSLNCHHLQIFCAFLNNASLQSRSSISGRAWLFSTFSLAVLSSYTTFSYRYASFLKVRTSTDLHALFSKYYTKRKRVTALSTFFSKRTRFWDQRTTHVKLPLTG
jgi:hypothetical protein